jgi:hypothetical protein
MADDRGAASPDLAGERDSLPDHEVQRPDEEGRIERMVWLLPGAGLPGLALYAAAEESWSALGVSLMVGAAAFLAGALLGFLFGIPRTLTAQADGVPIERRGRGWEYRPNTNLEQISDWLTKILVGVGLVQLGQLRESFGDLVDYLAPGLGNDGTARGFALALLVYFVIGGFLAGYLVTRLRLAGAFAYADRASLDAFVTRVARRTVDERAEQDAKALALVAQQLDTGDAPRSELEATVKAASRAAKIQIFLQAHQQRQASWKDDKPAMERTEPVFRALIASDERREYHRHFGELGFVLKDKTRPDWSEAEQLLETAIKIRDARKARGYRIYDFNLALCRIHLDPAFETGEPSEPERRELIVSDMRTAAKGAYSNRVLRENPEVNRWLQANGLSIDDVSEPPPE